MVTGSAGSMSIGGHGDDVVVLQANTTTTAAITHRGDSTFIVTSIDSSGSYTDQVNEIGNCSGAVPLATPALVEVQSSGEWNIDPSYLLPPEKVDRW